MDFLDFLIVGAVIGILVGTFQAIEKSQKKSKLKTKITNTSFSTKQQAVSEDGSTALGVDEKNKKIFIASSATPNNDPVTYSYRDILSVELFVDGIEVTKTSRASQLGGALLGGLALGGVGALIGGLSGSTKTKGKTRRIDIRLIVNDKNNPIYDVNFMDTESAPGGLVYEQAMKRARYWHGLVTVLIKEADAEDEDSSDLPASIPESSTADELMKLSDLHDKGVLSQEEFYNEKSKLLKRSNSNE
jgi:hypothetical protein